MGAWFFLGRRGAGGGGRVKTSLESAPPSSIADHRKRASGSSSDFVWYTQEPSLVKFALFFTDSRSC